MFCARLQGCQCDHKTRFAQLHASQGVDHFIQIRVKVEDTFKAVNVHDTELIEVPANVISLFLRLKLIGYKAERPGKMSLILDN
jgi:hypothetical protein